MVILIITYLIKRARAHTRLYIYIYIYIYKIQDNTICEELDLSDNYVEGIGASALAQMLKENMFIVNLVSEIIHN